MTANDDARRWAEDILSVMFGWAIGLVEEVYGEGLKGLGDDELLATYPMREFKRLYDGALKIGLIEEGQDAGRDIEG